MNFQAQENFENFYEFMTNKYTTDNSLKSHYMT